MGGVDRVKNGCFEVKSKRGIGIGGVTSRERSVDEI